MREAGQRFPSFRVWHIQGRWLVGCLGFLVAINVVSLEIMIGPLLASSEKMIPVDGWNPIPKFPTTGLGCFWNPRNQWDINCLYTNLNWWVHRISSINRLKASGFGYSKTSPRWSLNKKTTADFTHSSQSGFEKNQSASSIYIHIYINPFILVGFNLETAVDGSEILNSQTTRKSLQTTGCSLPTSTGEFTGFLKHQQYEQLLQTSSKDYFKLQGCCACFWISSLPAWNSSFWLAVACGPIEFARSPCKNMVSWRSSGGFSPGLSWWLS